MKYQIAFEDRSFAYLPPKLDKVPFNDEAIEYLLYNQPYTLLYYLHPSFVHLEPIYDSSSFESEKSVARHPGFCYPDRIPLKRQTDGVCIVFKDLKTMLKASRKVKDCIDVLTGNMSYV